MPTVKPPPFGDYYSLVQWSNNHHACPCCGDERDNSSFNCSLHAELWKQAANSGGTSDYEKWVREQQGVSHYNDCAACGQRCPADDYLCGACRV